VFQTKNCINRTEERRIKEIKSKYMKVGKRENYYYYYYYYYYLVCEAIGTAATPGLLCQPRVIVKMIVEKQMECRLAGNPKLWEKTCPNATFVHHKIPHDQTRV
jgi:hypothetical protein